jgi:hypothetical protein
MNPFLPHEAPVAAGASSLLGEVAERADRGRAERRVLRIGLVLAATFVGVSIATALLGGPSRVGWSTLHAALVGGATVAIGTFMPHFAVTLAGTQAEPAPRRIAIVLLLAAGAALVLTGMGPGPRLLAGVGASALLIGIAGTAWMAFAPMRRGIVRHHPIVQVTYGAALVQVAGGISIALGFVAGWAPITSAWASFKPAHVWLNLFGFVALTVSATLVYLLPTVAGTRIRPHASLVVLVLGCVAGPPVAAAGAALAIAPLGAAGAWLTMAGALGLVAYAVDVLRRRGRWAFDRDWHLLVMGHLIVATPWFVAAAAAVAVGVTRDGPSPPGWTLGSVAAPLVGGFVLQELVGSWSHLLPAVGPGDGAAHARQRDILGRWALPRLVAWNGAVALLWAGLGAGAGVLTVAGGLLLLATLGLSLGLLVAALRA